MATLNQTSTNDLEFTAGKLTLVKGAEACAIQLSNRFQFAKGESFLDTREGVPYFAYVFVKNPDLLLIKQLFRSIILETPGISSVESISTSFDSAARSLGFSFRARSVDGQTIIGGSGQPFIVEPS